MVRTLDSRMSANDPRNTEKARFGCCIGRVGEHVIERETGPGLVVSFGRLIDVDMSRRRDATGVESLHLLGVGHDVSKLACEELLFVGGQFELRERGYPLDVRDGKDRRHDWRCYHRQPVMGT